MLYQQKINDMNKFNLFLFTKTRDCILKLKTIQFEKTYILVSGSLSKEFFEEFERIISEILICPTIIIFTSTKKLNLIKKNLLNLTNFHFYDINLVFDFFFEVENKLLSQIKYEPNPKPIINYKNDDKCFTFEYINELRDLIFPLKLIEFIEFPSKIEIMEFNQFLLDNYCQNNKSLNELTKQLLIDTKIPIQILVKYWIRIYTIESPFYHEMNFTLNEKKNNDFDVYIRVLYQGLITKSIKPLIDQILYRGSKINIKEKNYILESLSKKKDNLPGCICYNKSFFSSSLSKEKNLDLNNVTNIDVQDYSVYKTEKEILFLPFSCFEIIKIKNCFYDGKEFIKINLSYIGKYKDKIDSSEKIPENEFVKDAFSSNICEKNEMNKESNKEKFDFKVEKYIPKNLKQSYIIAIYNVDENDINKKIQILNCDKEINEKELKKICNIFLDEQKIEFTFEYIFYKTGKYIFKFEFDDLLTNANKLFYGCSKLI